MARCRIGYLLALLGAGAFFLFFDDYFSFYILVLTLVFPLFSLVISLPAMLTVRASLAPSSHTVRRGETAVFTLSTSTRWKLPAGQVMAHMTCTNQMTGQVSRFRKKCPGLSTGVVLHIDVKEQHCGLLQCDVTNIKVCDLLGLFSRSLPRPEGCEIMSLPLELPAEEIPLLLGEEHGSPLLVPRPGGGPGEDYDLRPYRPGDPLRSVHWKLSSKADKLVVREMMEPARLQIVLTYDHFGPMDYVDRVFDRLDAVSRALIARERSHAIRWAHPISGQVHHQFISSLKDLRSFQHAALSTSVPGAGYSILDHTGLAVSPRLRHLHIMPAHKEGEMT